MIARQDKGTNVRAPLQKGSWDPATEPHGAQGGRVMTTSLALLMLEVYYRNPRSIPPGGEEKN